MWEKITSSPLLDVLDIIIVAYVLYRLIVFIKDTRVIQMLVGLGFLFLLSFLASSLGLIVVGRIIGTLQTVWVVAFIIIFQPELRSTLTHIGLRRGNWFFRTEEEMAQEFIDLGVKAFLIGWDSESVSGFPPVTNDYVAGVARDFTQSKKLRTCPAGCVPATANRFLSPYSDLG